jgi:nucleotide-binding universal stress UspA family protein
MKKILVPTDYSACAANAVRYAIQLARRSRLAPVFFHVLRGSVAETVRADMPGREDALALETEKLRSHIEQQYRRLGLKAGRLNLQVILSVSFRSALLDALRDKRFSLVIMGTHGISNLRERLFGTNTEHVVAASPVPVLSVPCRVKFDAFRSLAYFSDLSNVKAELPVIKRYAQLLGSKVSVVHFDYGWMRTPADEKLLKRLEADFPFKNIRVAIDRRLLDHIRMHHRDKKSLVCMFHDHKGVFEKLLSGSNPEEASARLNRPVLSFQRE